MFELITDKTLGEYESFIEKHPKGHFMQSSPWGRLKSEWKWQALCVRDGGGMICGTLSVLIRRLPGLPLTIMYGGRGPVCDIGDIDTLRELVAGARALAKRHRSYVLKLDPDVPASDAAFVSAMKGLGFRNSTGGKNFEGFQPRFVFRLDVAGKTEDELFGAFHQKTRYNIRLAERRGVTTKICGVEMVPVFSRIMLETGVRDGFVTRPAAYFEKLLDSLGDKARLYMAFFEGKPVSGTLAVHFGDKVWYLYGASSNEYRNVMPNYLLQREMIRWAIAENCRIYDFRGVSGDMTEDNPLYGLYRFKKGFSGELVEFCGEFDFVFNPVVEFAFQKASGLYRSARRAMFLFKNRRKTDGRNA